MSASSSSVALKSDDKKARKPKTVLVFDSDDDKAELSALTSAKASAPRPLTSAMADVKVLRAAMLSKGKRGTMKLNGLTHSTVSMPVMSGATSVSCTGTGVCVAALGFSALTAGPDWTLLTQLFECFRVKRMHYHFEPYVPTQWTTGQALHGPYIVCYDPESTSTIAFTALLSSRLITDKRMHFTNTSKSTKVAFNVEEKVLGTNGSVLQPTIGTWQSTTVGPNVSGGILTAVSTNAANASLTYGVATVQFDCEWGYRT